jgi:branched-chain amino acid transport system substrate-binding protein
VTVADTKLDPAEALRQMQRLAGLGIKLFIGPQSSAEVQVLRDYANRNGLLLISQSSTASSLAIPGDNVFRFCPDDTAEAVALTALLQADGVRAVVPMWRADAGNQGLRNSLQADFTAAGGTVTSGVEYTTTTSDFTADLQALKAQVNQMLQTHPAGQVAVYLAAFDENVAIFHQARTDPVLSSVRWYGSNGTAQSAALVGDPSAAQFAAERGYPCPIFGLDDATAQRWQPIAQEIHTCCGITPDAYALAAYDAFRVAANSYASLGGSWGTGSADALRAAFVQEANRYTGITGPTALNAAGDRSYGIYDFWAVGLSGLYQWNRVAGYRFGPDGTGHIVRFVYPFGE